MKQEIITLCCRLKDGLNLPMPLEGRKMKYIAFPEYGPIGVAGCELETLDGFLSGLGDLV